MKKTFKIIALLCAFTLASQAQTQKYSRVKVYTGTDGLLKLAELGVVVEHGEHKVNNYYTSDFSTLEIEQIKKSGLKYEVVIDDVAKFYEERNKLSNKVEGIQAPNCDDCHNGKVPVNFGYGSMGGYYTYQEMTGVLDSMTKKFPTIVSVKQTLDNTTTAEGRKVYYVKISDNPAAAEAEPQVLYTALHHAREAESMAQLLYYMWYLLENYSSNAEIKYLVDNSELYFVPCLNPDGYVYNQTTNPNGGGMCRKNRSPNSDGTFGTDINRNYGYKWGIDNVGSSPNTSMENYRGSAAFSEKETQMMKNFCNTHNFKIAMNYHGYGNLLIRPWGYQANTFTPDENVYLKFSEKMTICNSYLAGTPNMTVNYTGNGASGDWMYGEQVSKPMIIEFSPEVGNWNDGFWPAKSRIIPIAQGALQQNLYVARLAGQYAELKCLDEILTAKTKDYLHYSIQRLGLVQGTFTVSLKGLTNNVLSVGNPKTYNALTTNLQTQLDSIDYTLSTTMAEGELAKFVLSVSNGSFAWNDTIVKIVGTVTVPFTDNCSNLSNWTAGGWGLSTTQSVSASASITDSPTGNYTAGLNKMISTTANINLTDAVAAELVYYTKWDIDAVEDYVEVMVAANGGAFAPLCGNFTSNGGEVQDLHKPLYKNENKTWVKERINLDDYLGQNIKIGFKLVSSQNGGGKDGFYFDDIKVKKIIKPTIGINTVEVSGNELLQNMPNPCADYTTIHYNLQNKAGSNYLSIYNGIGEEVMKVPINTAQSNLLLNTQALPNGIYFYRINSDNNALTKTYRLVIVR